MENERVSVCMASYNGAKYIGEQLESIIKQLNEADEIIISDDGSTDETIQIIERINSPLIKLFHNHFRNHILNFEFALKQATGDLIFLSDQDDVWIENKVCIMKAYLAKYDIVCSNCHIVDESLNKLQKEFYTNTPEKRKGGIRNLIHNHYLGCCMAFRRKICDNALPFPKGLITHDTWIGLVAEFSGKTLFIDDKLILFRRHESNTSNTLKESNLSLFQKISYRYNILKGLCSNMLFRKHIIDKVR